ncbi:hypothetical protein LOTGIDRAFT_172134 [Lottia gigantea]|uniref:Uncharacterized protein n=1 Tax=Lottia gigantea TaxID=225164 RepID=V4AEF8_LOTGI|nr:hypothetical protein LOTGIDRAFT_172134 [Lottia gigantea]ESP02379.1 hypothetical protein LOTGIDRAFT_172134 [Lottia gigantea]
MTRKVLKISLAVLLLLGTKALDITTSLKDVKPLAVGSGTSPPKNSASVTLPKPTESSQSTEDSATTNDRSSLQQPNEAGVDVTQPPERSAFYGLSNSWFNDFSSNFADLSTNFHSTVNCSEPNNPSLLFNIGTDGTGYPVVAITNELNQRPAFGQFLVQEVPGPIVVPPDPVFDTANRTCPGVAQNVFSFNSALRGPCWVLQGFQDPLFTVTCQLGDCIGCSNSYSTSTTTHVGSTVTFKYKCIPQYKSISVWAYCPLVGFPAIIREQVIVPSFCSCVQTPCTKTTVSYGGW